MLIGYARSPKAGIPWVLDLQRAALLAAGVTPQKLYEDPACGLNDDHPGLAECLKSLRTGDTLVVWKLDRLGADLRHLVNLVHDLAHRGIGLKVLTGEGAAIDTTGANGRLVSGVFSALAECERERLVERTPPGPARARGIPRKMTAAQLLIAQAAMGKPGTNVAGLCAELGISAQTLYRHVDPRGELRPDGLRLLSKRGVPPHKREAVVECTRVGPTPPRARGRPHKMTAAQLRTAHAAMRKPETNVADLCARLGIGRTTLYRYVDPRGELRPAGLRLLGRRGRTARKPPPE